MRAAFEDGPFSTARGVFDGQRWHQNENGITVLEQPRRGAEAREREVVSLRHVTTPIVADVISELNPKGDGTQTFVDLGSSRVVRVEEIAPTETTVTTYDDFRSTGGYVRPWHEHETDGQAADERDVRIVSIATASVASADVAVPAPRRALVVFPAGATATALPVRLDDSQQFVVRVMIGSRGLDFLLDTGAAGISLDRATANGLGLKLYSEESNASNAGRYLESKAIVLEMKVGPLVMHDVAVRVAPTLQFDLPNAPVRVVGLLGFDFIGSLALTFDYEHGSVTASDYDAFTAPRDRNTFVLPIRVGQEAPETDVSIDGNIGEHFAIDTGAGGGVMITDVFTRRYPGITRGFRYRGAQIRLGGVGGEFSAPVYDVPTLSLGPLTFKDVAAFVLGSDRLYGKGGFDGVIGPELLSYFTMTTDYADSTIYLVPNHRAKLK